MKKIILNSVIFTFVFGFAISASAVVNDVTPSTNEENKTKGWAYVDATPSVGEVSLEFIQPRDHYACFEYRTDGETSQMTSSTNYNGDITDGLYPFKCLSTVGTFTKTLVADEYVEVRMVFGGETDERFDWTRFDVLFDRTAEITSPLEGSVVSGMVNFEAVLNDKDGDDAVQWAVREGTCAAGTNTVFGNVDGFGNDYNWNGENFSAVADTSSWNDGEYCFIFNPTESSGDKPIRETSEFFINNTPDSKDQCKKDGWETFFAPEFKNQGDCVSYVQSNENAKGNKNK